MRRKVIGYVADIVFKDCHSDYVFKGVHMTTSKDKNTVRISVATDRPEFTYEWENEMINGVLNGFKGTDWPTVKEIIYM